MTITKIKLSFDDFKTSLKLWLVKDGFIFNKPKDLGHSIVTEFKKPGSSKVYFVVYRKDEDSVYLANSFKHHYARYLREAKSG